MRLKTAWIALALLLIACDPSGAPLDDLRLARLKPGQSTEADVLRLFGQADMVRPRPSGHGLVYPLGPEGAVTLLIEIDGAGLYQGASNLLTPANFAQVRPGMSGVEVQALLGRPGSSQSYRLQKQSTWSWRFLDQPTTRLFVVTFDDRGKVVLAGVEDDSRTQGGR